MNRTPVLIRVLIVALLVAGCSGQKEPATQAVNAVETSINAMREDASKYASEQYAQLQASLASLKDSLSKGDYKTVLANAPALSSQISTLQQTVDQKKTEAQAAMAAATTQWQALSADVPKMVDAIQSRVDILSQSKKLPKNVTQAQFDSAKEGLFKLKETWGQASSLFSAGDPVAAAAKAQTAKDSGMEILKALGMG
jgi:chromosome segregation ATPase